MPSGFIQLIGILIEAYLNTQTHLLLAAALFARSSKTDPNHTLQVAQTQSSQRGLNLAVLTGAMLPDISLFVMWGQAKARGISDDVIWGELYFSSLWQEIGAITNSIPLFAFIAILGFLLGGRLWTNNQNLTPVKNLGFVLLLLSSAALVHCLSDLPLHVDDGHAHFWPFSDWIYASPVSYWDSNHYAHYWQPIEIVIALICIIIIWRRFSSIWVRLTAIAGLLSFALIIAYWTYAMG